MWCRNVLEITGPAADRDRFRREMSRTVTSRSGNDVLVPLLFEALLPRPKDLDIEESSVGHRGYQALYGDWQALVAQPRFAKAGVKDRASLIRVLEQLDEKHFSLAQRYRLNECKFGFRTWYDWNIEHYGTKWDLNLSTEVTSEADTLRYLFDTYENPPMSWLELAQSTYPTLRMKLVHRNSWKEALAADLPLNRF